MAAGAAEHAIRREPFVEEEVTPEFVLEASRLLRKSIISIEPNDVVLQTNDLDLDREDDPMVFLSM